MLDGIREQKPTFEGTIDLLFGPIKRKFGPSNSKAIEKSVVWTPLRTTFPSTIDARENRKTLYLLRYMAKLENRHSDG